MNKTVNIILICFCIAVIAFCGYKLIPYFTENHRAEQAYDELRPPELSDTETADQTTTYDDLLPYYQQLKEQNGHFIGWLMIPGTNVNYPVMQTPQEPEYYLYRDFHQKDAPSGSLFASEISNVNKPSDAVIIYGHRMKTGAMFGNFGKLIEEDYLADHNRVIFDTLTNRNEYRIWCVFTEAVGTGSTNEFQYYNYSDFQNEQDFANFVSRATTLSNVMDMDAAPKYGDKILMLSTCEYTHENGRLVVIAVQTSPETIATE